MSVACCGVRGVSNRFLVLAVAVTAGLTLALSVCAQTPPEACQRFADFDRVYIPALALTKQKSSTAGEALLRAQRGWGETVSCVKRQRPGDADWQKGIDQIESHLQEAARLVKADDLQGAHETLEAIRDILREERRRCGWEYDLDVLTDFHDVMEAIVKPYNPREDEPAPRIDHASLDALLPTAQRRLAAIQSLQFDPATYHLPASKAEQLQPTITELGQVLDQITASVKERQDQEALAAIRRLQPTFARLYMIFGDFPMSGGPST